MQHSPNRKELIEAIHASDLRLSLVLTGGGSALISELLAIPGASQTILEANVPYSEKSLAKFLGKTPELFCSPETAQMLAAQAYINSYQIHGTGVTAVGCTAALATTTPKKGEHRFFKSIQTGNRTTLMQVTLEKGKRTRLEEEDLLVEFGLSELGGLIGIDYEPKGFSISDQKVKQQIEVIPEWSEVFHRQKAFCAASTDSQSAPRGVGILAGSFNPLHSGHLEMASKFEQKFGISAQFELTINNADKPPIDFLTIQTRLDQFFGQQVWLTNSATFVEKSKLFPGNLFIVGLDTIERVSDPKYYPSPNGLEEAIREIRENECRFVVYGRHDGSRFLTLADLPINASLRKLCEEIPESEFRKDISSTIIRQGISQSDNHLPKRFE